MATGAAPAPSTFPFAIRCLNPGISLAKFARIKGSGILQRRVCSCRNLQSLIAVPAIVYGETIRALFLRNNWPL